MPRLALGVEYDGCEFAGWQYQRSARTVQEMLERAIAAVAASPVTAHAAGRTDAGVHAAGQVVHFDASVTRSPRQWLLGINSNLPPDVSISWTREVPAEFHARRSALWRRYRYLIQQGSTRSALARRRSAWVREPLDCDAMTSAAAAWIGEHDFSSFRAVGCQSNSPFRCMQSIEIEARGTWVAFEFTANAFLYHMVRNLVGTLIEIGRGRQGPDWAAELLVGRDRKLAAATAPPEGLSLVAIGYPSEYDIPVSQRGVWLP
jgi:tRNA pseudouridine38-40 synthase